ncbi:MAG TPA: TIR domain-containing protein [Ktedonobacteraceae bacterium]|nr:TIR domain-containing protein [Ktedonobacteraceae bacterium]
MTSKDYYDVCIICALHEEAEAFLDVLKTHGTEPEEEYSPQLRRNFFSATIQNGKGEPLNLFITWAPDMGGSDIQDDLGRLLDVFPIRFAAMTGICAGNKDKVKLGDLIVAESTYLHDSGSYVSTADGGSKHLYNVKNIQLLQPILQAVHGFEDWQKEGSQITRPISKRQQTDWLLNTLLEKKNVRAINFTDLDTHAPKWRSIVQELKQGTEPFLDGKMQLNESLVTELIYGPEEFPYQDPSTPTCHIGPMASGNSVRKDNPFLEISQPVSKVLGLDMECWAFYHTLRERNINYLFVKGVCDYGDSSKDDSYHKYAATLSATYMHAFIKKFVTEERMPAGRPFLRTVPRPIPSTSGTTKNSQQETNKQPVKIFFSYSQSPKDEALIKALNNHLAPLRRLKSIESWYRDDIYAGDNVEKDVEGKLKEAQIIILLLTPDYIGSDLYDQEYKLIQARYNEGATVIPVHLRATPNFLEDEFYGVLMPLPLSGPPIASANNQDEVMAKVAEDLRNVIDNLAGKS